MHLLQGNLQIQREQDEQARRAACSRIREALAEWLPGIPVWVYGSVLEPGRFRRESSDADLALERVPESGPGLYELQSRLSSRIGIEADLVLLNETRLRSKIVRTGERWIESPSRS